MNKATSALPRDAQSISIAGFNLFAGPFYRLADDGAVRRFAFVPEPRHMNSAGSVHGGALMTFADIAMSRSARLESGAASCSTVSLNCDFVNAGCEGAVIVARVAVVRAARTLVFLSAELAADTLVVMTASGLWRIVPP